MSQEASRLLLRFTPPRDLVLSLGSDSVPCGSSLICKAGKMNRLHSLSSSRFTEKFSGKYRELCVYAVLGT